MNNEFDFNSKKFVLLMILVCVIFFIMIVKAFEYIPEAMDDSYTFEKRLENLNKANENTEDNTSENIEQEKDKHKLNIVLPQGDYIPEIEDDNDLDLPPQTLGNTNDYTESQDNNGKTEITPEQQRANILNSARAYKKNKQYIDALKEYQKVLEQTSDKTELASLYEEIAVLYATVKKYGTALSFAQQAYNMEPTTSREMLLARIYYKTGDIVKSKQRVNNVLQRDFAADRE